MLTPRKVTVAAVSAAVAALTLAAPASAAPGDNPCELAANFLCQFVPIAPNLEGNIDLTQQQPVDTAPPPSESVPPALPCANGCI